MALHHRPVFADKKVIICALCFIQFVVYSMRNPVVYRTAKKVVLYYRFKVSVNENLHCSILFFLDFWHEWVLNFILAEKESQKVLLTLLRPRANVESKSRRIHLK